MGDAAAASRYFFTHTVGEQSGGSRPEIWAECQKQNMNKKESLSHTLVRYLCPESFSVKLHAGRQLCGKLGDLSAIFTVTVKQGVSYTQCACLCVCVCV